jgi:hypothetical protein
VISGAREVIEKIAGPIVLVMASVIFVAGVLWSGLVLLLGNTGAGDPNILQYFMALLRPLLGMAFAVTALAMTANKKRLWGLCLACIGLLVMTPFLRLPLP